MNYTRLGTAKEQDRNSIFYNPGDLAWLGSNRIAMSESRIEPGEIATFTFRSVAPYTTDIFREFFQPITENVGWMTAKESTFYVDVSIGEPGYEYDKAVFYLGKSGQASMIDTTQPITINVDISEQKMIIKIGDFVVREYLVSTGTFKTPTPIGKFKILNKQELRIAGAYPHYRMPKWQGFTKWGHGLHALPYLANDRGTFWNEALTHIGQRVSHGCIRLLPEDAGELYQLTDVGVEVNIQA
ncbi:MAG: L,D-transpeptidase [Patescibacteria group bacterium]